MGGRSVITLKKKRLAKKLFFNLKSSLWKTECCYISRDRKMKYMNR